MPSCPDIGGIQCPTYRARVGESCQCLRIMVRSTVVQYHRDNHYTQSLNERIVNQICILTIAVIFILNYESLYSIMSKLVVTDTLAMSKLK